MHAFKNGGTENLFISITEQIPNINFYLLSISNEVDYHQISKLPKNVHFIHCKYKSILTRFIKLESYLSKNYKNVPCIIDFHETLLSEVFTLINSRKKICVHWFNSNPSMRLKNKKIDLYYRFYSLYKKTICICQTQKEILMRTVPKINRDSILVSYNFVNIPQIIDKSKVSIDFNYKYIFHVSRIDFGSKDLQTLIRAYEILPNYVTSIYKLVIAGDGPDFEKLKNIRDKSIQKDNIFLLGNLQNPYVWMRNASLFVVSSLVEGFSLTLLEALCLGCPIISSDFLCGAREILEFNEQKYGLIFKIGDSKELSSLMVKILINEDFAKEFMKKAPERAEYFYINGLEMMKDIFNNKRLLDTK